MTIDVECPGCGSTSFDESFDVVDGFCENCGVAIPDADNVEELPHIPEYDDVSDDSDASKPESWSDWYSVTNSTEQRAATAYEHLERISDSLGLSTETRIQAAELYGEAAINLVTDGRPSDVTIAALLYLASRETNEPRPASAFTRAIDHEEVGMKSLVRSLQRELKLEFPIPEPEDYLPYLAAELDVGEATVEDAHEVLNVVTRNGQMTGKNPVSIAGAALYREGEDHSQREIAQAAGVTKETIRKRLNEVETRLGKVGPLGMEGDVNE